MPLPQNPAQPQSEGQGPSPTPSQSPIIGGPGLGTDASGPGTPTGGAPAGTSPAPSSASVGGEQNPPAEGSSAVPQSQTPASPVIFAGKVFNTSAEALAYANQLELARQAQPQVPAAAAPGNPQAEPEVADVLFEDPKTAIKILKDQIRNEVRQEISVEDTRKKTWDDFYQKHPDLRGFEDVVEFVQSKNWNTLRELPVAQGLPQVAKMAREHLSRIRGSANVGEKLPSGPAVVAGSSGAPAPSLPQPKAQPTTFVDELKQMRRRN